MTRIIAVRAINYFFLLLNNKQGRRTCSAETGETGEKVKKKNGSSVASCINNKKARKF